MFSTALGSAQAGRLSFTETPWHDSDQQDANSALTELDKGLRSGRQGEQCETIVRFPRLFEKYPFPILINSACLKLAEVFRANQSNFLRLLILRVMQESEKHLDKILSVDEFVRRIFIVMYSNDPVARALTLRTLGSISCVVKDRSNVHHSIRTSLESNDTVELEAAIYACSRFSAVSQQFASSICPIVAHMMNKLSTPVDIKLKLLSVFSNMAHDAQTANQVRELCLSLLPTHPAQNFVVEILSVLTKLAASSVFHITSHIHLLLEHLESDPRAGVRGQALSDLRILAENGRWAHLWATEHVDRLVSYAFSTPYIRLKCQAVRVLVLLARSLAVHCMDLSPSSTILSLCTECTYHDDIRLAAVSSELLTQLTVHVCKENLSNMDLMRNTCSAVETLLLLVTSPAVNSFIAKTVTSASAVMQPEISTSTPRHLKKALTALPQEKNLQQSLAACKHLSRSSTPPRSVMAINSAASYAHCSSEAARAAALPLALRCVVELCRADVTLCSHFVDVLAAFISSDYNEAVCHTLAAIGAERASVLAHLEPLFWRCLSERPLIIWTLLLQANVTSGGKVGNGRAALGQLDFPRELIDGSLSSCVSSSACICCKEDSEEVAALKHPDLCEKNNVGGCFTRGVICSAWDRYRLARQAAHYGQHRAVQTLVENLETAVSSEHFYFWLIAIRDLAIAEQTRCAGHYATALSALKAATTPSYGLQFQVDYVRLRAQMILLAHQLEDAASCLRTCPPPAIAATLAAQTRDDQLKCGRVVSQLRKSARDWRVVSEQWASLIESSFDADGLSLQHLRIMQHKCQLIGQAAAYVSQCNQGIGSQLSILDPWSGSSPCSSSFRDYEAKQKASTLFRELGESVEGLTVAKVSALMEISNLLVNVPLHVPRHFFQRLQKTVLQLAVSPQQTNPNEPVYIAGWQLSLKVEGVVQQSASAHRKVHKVRLKVTTGESVPSYCLEEIATPRNDYFSAEFLVSLPTAGIYYIYIDTAVLDYEQHVWTTGPREGLMVKSHEDSSTKRLYMQRN